MDNICQLLNYLTISQVDLEALKDILALYMHIPHRKNPRQSCRIFALITSENKNFRLVIWIEMFAFEPGSPWLLTRIDFGCLHFGAQVVFACGLEGLFVEITHLMLDEVLVC